MKTKFFPFHNFLIQQTMNNRKKGQWKSYKQSLKVCHVRVVKKLQQREL